MLFALTIIKYAGALIGLAYTVYCLGDAEARRKKRSKRKARKSLLLTIAFVLLVSLLEWVIFIRSL